MGEFGEPINIVLPFQGARFPLEGSLGVTDVNIGWLMSI